MDKYSGADSGSFVNYLNDNTAVPAALMPLPSCASESDDFWILQEDHEVVEYTTKED